MSEDAMTRTLGNPTPDEFRRIQHLVVEFALDGSELDPVRFIVARVNGELAGFARTKSFPDFVEFCSLGVLPRFRGAGIGGMLVREQIRRFGDLPVFIATVIPEFFAPFGFEPIAAFPAEMAAKLQVCGTICHATTPTVMRLQTVPSR
jgi:N-acetylglutamate synthase-like GNAT family acetyltransferase